MGSGAGLAQAVANNQRLRESLAAYFNRFTPQPAPAAPPPPAPAPPPPAPTVTPYVPEYLTPQPSFGDSMSAASPAPAPPPPPPPPDIYSSAGADGAVGASGYTSKKSSWKASGQSTKGTNNLKLQIQKGASGTGLNITG